MKQIYNTPKMIVHGNLAKLTQSAGEDKTSDVLIFNGRVVSSSNDSLDVILNPDGTTTKTPAVPR